MEWDTIALIHMSNFVFLLHLFIYLFIGGGQPGHGMCLEVRGQLVGVSFLLGIEFRSLGSAVNISILWATSLATE